MQKPHRLNIYIYIYIYIFDITNLAVKAALNTKAAEVESKIPGITNLATKTALNTKATEIGKKILYSTSFITRPEFNRLTKINFNTRMKQEAKSLASTGQVDTAALDIADKNREKMKKLPTFDLSHFNSKRLFDDDGSLSYLISQPNF